MLKIVNQIGEIQAIIKHPVDPRISEQINGEYTFSFSALIDADHSPHIHHNNLADINGEIFDIVRYVKRNRGGLYVDTECEHVSYRLNNYELEFFTVDGSPLDVLTELLKDTPFIPGVVEPTNTVTISIREKMTKRAILLEFALALGAEIKYDRFTVSILQRRGNDKGLQFRTGKNLLGISKEVDAKGEAPRIVYDVDILELSENPEYKALGYADLEKVELGETVSVIDADLEINEQQRIMSYEYDPIRKINSKVEIANIYLTIADSLIRVQRDSVVKDEIYNGARIGPEYGFESVRSDKKARAYFRADGMKFQSGDGTGENWVDRLFYEYDAATDKTVLTFDGKLSVDTMNAIKGEVDLMITNTTIVQNLYSEYGRIANLSVSELNTGWKKITNYLASDPSDVNYIQAYDQYMEWVTASAGTTPTVEQFTDSNGTPLYWTDGTYTGMTDQVTAYPVNVYVYTETVKLKIAFDGGTENKEVKMSLGAGYANPLDPNRGKFFVDKNLNGGLLEFIKSDGKKLGLSIGEDGVKIKQDDVIGLELFSGAIEYRTEFGDVVGSGTLYFQTGYTDKPTYLVRTVGGTSTIELLTSAGKYIGCTVTADNASVVTSLVFYCTLRP